MFTFRKALFALGTALAMVACGTSETEVGSTSAVLSVVPTEVAFGDVAVGEARSEDVTVVNAQPTELELTDVWADGDGVSVSGLDLPRVLAPGETITFQ
ncbi:MAG TPA: hypothetical protein VD838_03535, partial [Anaeromyxobacteraceae bacterium]|nr:hypothetical protein [Anaeromyxobacteraceae bacterium]